MGLTIQGSSIAYAHEQTDAGFWVDIGPLVLRCCSTTAEALDLIDRYSTMTGPSNLVLIDGDCDAAAVEKSKNTYAVRRTDTPWIFTTDGVAVEEKTSAIQGQTSLHEFHVARHRMIERLLNEHESNPSVDAMRRIMARPHAAVAGVQAPRPDAGRLSAGHAVQLPPGAAHRGVLLLGHAPRTRVPLHLRADPPSLLVRVAITPVWAEHASGLIRVIGQAFPWDGSTMRCWMVSPRLNSPCSSAGTTARRFGAFGRCWPGAIASSARERGAPSGLSVSHRARPLTGRREGAWSRRVPFRRVRPL